MKGMPKDTKPNTCKVMFKTKGKQVIKMNNSILKLFNNLRKRKNMKYSTVDPFGRYYNLIILMFKPTSTLNIFE